MANSSLQQKLIDLLVNSPSFLSLDEQKKSEMRNRLMALPEKEMAEAIKIFEDEQNKSEQGSENLEEIKTLTADIKSGTKTLQKAFLKTQENKETAKSEEESNGLLKMLDS